MTASLRARGVTLPEVLVASAILAIVLALLLGVTVMTHRTLMIGQAQVSATQEARRGLEEMARELTLAPAAEITDDTGVSTWPPDEAWTGIRFRYPESVDSGGAVDEWSAYITYALDGTQLLRTDDTGASRVVANGVTDLAFQRGSDTSDDVVLIELTAERTAPTGHAARQPLQLRIQLRNP